MLYEDGNAFEEMGGNRREFVTGLVHGLANRLARKGWRPDASDLVAYVAELANELERRGEADWMADEDDADTSDTLDISQLEREIDRTDNPN
jgi:hypothetical protein